MNPLKGKEGEEKREEKDNNHDYAGARACEDKLRQQRVAEVEAFRVEIGGDVDPEVFVDYYLSNHRGRPQKWQARYRNWTKNGKRGGRREERQNRTYYERIEPWDGTKTLIDPKSVSRIIDTIDQRAIMRLQSASIYIKNHAPKLRKTLSLVLKNGAKRRSESQLTILKNILEDELLRRSKRSLLPKRSKPRLKWRRRPTRGRETSS